MRKEFIFLLVLLFLLASCSNSGTTVSNERAFIGGTTGLLINFVEGEPPGEVTDGDATPFTVTMKLENQGETFVSKTSSKSSVVIASLFSIFVLIVSVTVFVF